ncbi:MAG TPA: hypothetical protein VF284_04220 [Rhodanobacteraceae bacterium]
MSVPEAIEAVRGIARFWEVFHALGAGLRTFCPCATPAAVNKQPVKLDS